MKKVLLAFLLAPVLANAQIITTVGGDGTAGYGGDGGAATVAVINHPIELAIDSSGNVYFAEYGNNCIRKINTAGIISTVAGNTIPGYAGDGGAAISAELNEPYGIAIDKSGNLYIGDNGNNCIRKVDTNGIITTIAGTGYGGFGGDGGPAISAMLLGPTFVLADSLGNIYIDDSKNQRIRKIDNSGNINTVAGNGTIGYSGDGFAATDAELQWPFGIWKDATGNLYIADGGNNAVRKVSTTGIISTIAGTGYPGYSGDGGPATASEINSPLEVTMDNKGNLYFADNVNNRIRKIDTSGIITTVAGNGIEGYAGDGLAPTHAEFNGINGMRFNAAGELYIADVFNSRIRKIDFCENTIYSQPINDTVFSGLNAVYSVTTTMPSPVYQWQEDPGTGFVNLANVWPYSGVTTSALTISEASIYLDSTHYRCVISNGSSCADTTTGAILIIKTPSGVKNVNAISETTLYPNPATTNITIACSSRITSVIITNLLGQPVSISEYNAKQAEINISSLAAGVYFVKINGNEVRKFVKE